MTEFEGKQISFCIPISSAQVDIILNWFEKRRIRDLVGILYNAGAAIPPNAKFIMDLGWDNPDAQEKTDVSTRKDGDLTIVAPRYWFATIDQLEHGEDGVFVRLRTPGSGEQEPLPRFSDMFKMVNIEPTDSDEVTKKKLEQAFGKSED